MQISENVYCNLNIQFKKLRYNIIIYRGVSKYIINLFLGMFVFWELPIVSLPFQSSLNQFTYIPSYC